ncbi:protocatechuate 3,4-dioxygenase subunit alpha [Cereibacter changlensis JA139]|uniref:Protocatechuate 3,4-dioxygenase subunit alpha n=2 Tax=Cereibacter changlensis TaxID=402884 RepID=A0A2T4JQ70_9RHOB|nr:protocatechuate 3,4-dioxygenase subunit alpha [Cereibacter changlensis]PTE20036.1 protocatechuate 3,4-dioxygenase subunit alpha [Cereibacter changlensis JA139]PZX56387.1 protocatechuate 3,4-dioxygenase alpha subunit [Cereibacter changlensis]
MQPLDYLKETPSQTAGPFVHIGLTPNKLGIGGVYPQDLGDSPIREEAKGQQITIVGTVRDGAGMILRDALIESWQADAAGIYPGNDPRGAADPNVGGWARIIADFDTGEWVLKTIKPGAVPYPDGRMMAPHISLWIVARGINLGLQTRVHFEDEDNSACPVLGRIEHRDRVQTLIAKKTGPDNYRFDIVLQGENETVFFDI